MRVYDTGGTGPALFWLHGTPNTGAPPEPLFPAAARHGIRWIGYDRPGYGGSPREPGRTMASAAAHVSAIADRLGIDRFAVMGHSSGGPHALACAALLPDRVLAAVSISGPARWRSGGPDWSGAPAGAEEADLRAAARGREALERHIAASEFDPEQFTPGDFAALDGEWGWIGRIAADGAHTDQGGTVDDNLANVGPWGFDPTTIKVPVLFVHGEADRMVPSAHSEWLAARIASAQLWLRPGEGHISILSSAPATLDWLTSHL
ncbi:alpha/beta hydrolase [Micromonospora sp. CPCC 205371]|nr:alpha/beta hydrolase [Micromonospora sp. CPCC 205371]